MKFQFFPEFDPADQLYCSIAAAVIGAGALGAGASIWGANKASDAQTNAANAAITQQQGMYASNKGILQPFIDAGTSGIGKLQDWINPTSGTNPLASLIKLVTPGADMSSTLEQTPGYQFQAGQGTRAALNALAARGLGGSPGAIAKGVGGYVSGLAGSTWQNIVAALSGVQGQETNALQGVVNTGTSAGGALAGVGTNTANSITGSLTGAGNAQAAGANATGAAIGGLGNSVTTAMLLKQLTGGGGGGSIYGGIPGAEGPTSYGGAPLFGAG